MRCVPLASDEWSRASGTRGAHGLGAHTSSSEISPLSDSRSACRRDTSPSLDEDTASFASILLTCRPSASTSARIARIASRLLEVEELEDFVEAGPLGEPVGDTYRQTSDFGVRIDPFNGRPTSHRGMDFAAYRRAPIEATGPGRVIYAGWRGGYGRTVEIDHGYGFVTRYGHLHEIDVRRGDTVERGQRIGGMGSTGRSTATHLHYEIWYNGSAIDPERLLRAGQYVQQG